MAVKMSAAQHYDLHSRGEEDWRQELKTIMTTIGAETKQTVRGNSGMQTAMSMMETGRTTKPTALESICTSMVLGTKVTGATICRMGPALSRGPMAPATRVAT